MPLLISKTFIIYKDLVKKRLKKVILKVYVGTHDLRLILRNVVIVVLLGCMMSFLIVYEEVQFKGFPELA